MMRPLLITWSIAFGVLLAAFGATIAILNGTLYSASGFVDSYLDALERRDAVTALDMPGVLGADDAASDLLAEPAMSGFPEKRSISERAGTDGVHTVTVKYHMAGEPRQTAFRVKPTDALFGLFSTWAFDSSPLASVAVTVLHDDRFRANGIDLTARTDASDSARYLVFTPGLYTFDHKSTYLSADPIPVVVADPGSVTAVQVNVQANDAFVHEVRTQLVQFLDDCASQEVLLPTGCPFGTTVQNRVHSTPAWSITSYPDVEIVPGRERRAWLLPNTDGVAHITVEEQSIFDGSISTLDEDVPFNLSYFITLLPGDRIHIETSK